MKHPNIKICLNQEAKKKFSFKHETCRVRHHKHLTCDLVSRNSAAQTSYFEDCETCKYR